MPEVKELLSEEKDMTETTRLLSETIKQQSDGKEKMERKKRIKMLTHVM